MRKWLSLLGVLLVVSLMGCPNNGLSGGKPPEAFVEVAGERFEMILGTYCWKSTCVDTAGPVDTLAGKETIKVKPGEVITFVMDYEPLPSEIHLAQYIEEKETEIMVKNHRFTAPTEKGIYYYSYGVWWMSDKEEDVTNGDAFYNFALEVQ